MLVVDSVTAGFASSANMFQSLEGSGGVGLSVGAGTTAMCIGYDQGNGLADPIINGTLTLLTTGGTTPRFNLPIQLNVTGLTTLTQNAWTPLANGGYQNSWTNYGNGNLTAAWFKDSQGVVHLRGMVSGGTIGTGGAGIISQLPVSARPSSNANFAVASNSVFGYCLVDSAGNIRAMAGSNVWFSLDGITFDTRS